MYQSPGIILGHELDALERTSLSGLPFSSISSSMYSSTACTLYNKQSGTLHPVCAEATSPRCTIVLSAGEYVGEHNTASGTLLPVVRPDALVPGL